MANQQPGEREPEHHAARVAEEDASFPPRLPAGVHHQEAKDRTEEHRDDQRTGAVTRTGAEEQQPGFANLEGVAERLGLRLNLKWVCDKDDARRDAVPLAASAKTADAQQVLADPEVPIVIELVGGTGFARTLILDALRRGKVVVTANKALLAHHGEEIFAAAAAHNTNLFYEASVCGGIPIIKAVREGFVANQFPLIYGIVNGTCNYILTRMTAEGKDFEEVLAEAQQLGYAEADPGLDVDGIDSAHKATILASLAHGFWTGYESQIRNEWLTDIVLTDGWIRAYWRWHQQMPELATESMTPETLRWLEDYPEWDPRIQKITLEELRASGTDDSERDECLSSVLQVDHVELATVPPCEIGRAHV